MGSEQELPVRLKELLELITPLSQDQITDEIAFKALKAVESRKATRRGLQATAEMYAAYTIIRDRELIEARRELTALRSRLAGVTKERDDARSRLGPLATGDISGLSGDGLSYVVCTRKDSDRIRDGLHALAIDPQLREANMRERERAESAERRLAEVEGLAHGLYITALDRDGIPAVFMGAYKRLLPTAEPMQVKEGGDA